MVSQEEKLRFVSEIAIEIYVRDAEIKVARFLHRNLFAERRDGSEDCLGLCSEKEKCLCSWKKGLSTKKELEK